MIRREREQEHCRAELKRKDTEDKRAPSTKGIHLLWYRT